MSKDETEEDHPEFRALCMAVGFVVVHWAINEQQIDNWVNVAFRKCGGDALRKTGDIPTSFRVKIDFLKTCFKTLPQLAPFASEGQALLTRASAMAVERNNLMHASLVNMIPGEEGFQFRKVAYLKDNHAVSYFTFDPIAFQNLETAIGVLLTDQLAMSQRLAERFLA